MTNILKKVFWSEVHLYEMTCYKILTLTEDYPVLGVLVVCVKRTNL